jgi:hypothetical protein
MIPSTSTHLECRDTQHPSSMPPNCPTYCSSNSPILVYALQIPRSLGIITGRESFSWPIIVIKLPAKSILVSPRLDLRLSTQHHLRHTNPATLAAIPTSLALSPNTLLSSATQSRVPTQLLDPVLDVMLQTHSSTAAKPRRPLPPMY